jgi:2Fe-2S ferredoxin
MDNIQEISDKEEDFIDRAVNPRITRAWVASV